MKMKSVHRSEFSNLTNWKEEALKNQSFNGIRTRDLSYEATHWERGQFIEFISPMRSEMIYNRSSNIWIISYILHIFFKPTWQLSQHKTKNPLESKICGNSSFQQFLYIMKVNSQEGQ